MSNSRRTVLVADSDPSTRERTFLAFQQAGYKCVLAEDGHQAVARLKEGSFDLLVTDVVLPKLHGHALIVETLSQYPQPRIIALSDLVDARIVRDLLSRGIDDYMHKSVPVELLVTKAQSLFDLGTWRAGQMAATDDPEPQLTTYDRLELIEQQLQLLSDYFADRVADLFEQEYSVPEIPPGLMKYIDRLKDEETAQKEAGISSEANTRGAHRVDIKVVATAFQVDENYEAVDFPVNVVLSDISASGVRLLHTRAIPATDLVVAWSSITMPHYIFRIPLCVTRCRPSGRFYDIGGQFDIPQELEADMKAIAGMHGTATN
ncbi:response regulator [Aeoliella mucimassa]|nr:response regulator [Aeoliella mucimassa]